MYKTVANRLRAITIWFNTAIAMLENMDNIFFSFLVHLKIFADMCIYLLTYLYIAPSVSNCTLDKVNIDR